MNGSEATSPPAEWPSLTESLVGKAIVSGENGIVDDVPGRYK
jgi:hypothetical protein